MKNDLTLERYLNDGVASLIRDALKATWHNPRASAFWARYSLAAAKAEARRQKVEGCGEHAPLFLIASIASQCNLHCVGCYDRTNHIGAHIGAHISAASASRMEMSAQDWRRIFDQAEKLGVSAILLAGGEPLTRMDVIEEACRRPSILFPVFTNGTLMEGAVPRVFDAHRNLVPIVSLEGDENFTDARRGPGVYAKVMRAMEKLKAMGVLFGASITVTSQNLTAVTGEATISSLCEKGCKAIVFVEYVPVEKQELALTEEDRRVLAGKVNELRAREKMIMISFPGDEAESGGCLAAGRGFFHISASGNAEPCPFYPYADTNLKNVSLQEALRSPLFRRLKDEGILLREHMGGCVLFDQTEYARVLLAGQ